MKNQTKTLSMLLILAAVISFLFSACHKHCDEGCDGYTTETVSITEPIIGVIIEGPWSVSITQSDTDNSAELKYCTSNKVKVTAQQLPNGYLKIRVTSRLNRINFDDFKATIKATTLEKIEGSGACNIRTYGHFESLSNISLSGASIITGLSSEGTTVKIELSGASNLKEFTFEGKKIDANFSGASIGRFDNVQVEDLQFDCSGASNINCSGYAEKTSFNGSGASILKTLNLESENLYIDLSGASNAEVNVNKTIKGRASGASILKYRNNEGLNINVSTSGGSKLIPI